MLMKIDDLKVNDLVFVSLNGQDEVYCITNINQAKEEVSAKTIREEKFAEEEVFSIRVLKPILLLDSTLVALGFKKAGSPYEEAQGERHYVYEREDKKIEVVCIDDIWYYFYFSEGRLVKKEIFIHELQNLISNDKNAADPVDEERFKSLSRKYCILPYNPSFEES